MYKYQKLKKQNPLSDTARLATQTLARVFRFHRTLTASLLIPESGHCGSNNGVSSLAANHQAFLG